MARTLAATRRLQLRRERRSRRRVRDRHAALRTLREFIWGDLADDYVELAKGRLYEGRPGERDAARAALFTAVSASLRMLAPFAPFLTEEAWHALPGTEGSVHGSAWPEPGMADREADAVGAIIADAASTVRGWKSEAGLALNEPLDGVGVSGPVTRRAG